jgi:putative peptidoglycan lipid II flippase
MTAERTAAIGLTIRWFAPAVVFYCAVKAVVPFFHAQGQVRVPVIASLAAVASNIACALLSYRFTDLEWNGLALAVGVGQVANLAVLLAVAGALHGWPRAGLVARLGKIALASAVCAAAAALVLALLPEGGGRGMRFVRGLAPVGAGAAAYFAAGAALRCPEITRLLRAAGRTLSR